MKKKNQYYAIDNFIKEVIILYNQRFYLMKITNWSKKIFKRFWKKKIIIG